jgi:hypothetical protein
MLIRVALAWLLVAGLVLFGFFVVALAHFVLMGVSRRRRQPGERCRRVRVYLVAAGLLFMQLMSEIYSPGTAFLLQQIRGEDADEDDQGDPDSPEKHFDRQLRRIRRGEPVDQLVLRI